MTTTELGKYLGGYSRMQILRFIDKGLIEGERAPGTGNHYRFTQEQADKAKEKFKVHATAWRDRR